MKRRLVTQAMAAAWAGQALPGLAGPAPRGRAAGEAGSAEKVLRYAFQVAETGFDPAQISDIYSRICTAHIFDSLLTYDYLARPFKLKPLTAEAMPEVSDDFRTFTFKVRPGIFFADDPAFKGQKRELVAEDFVYSFKRIYDPKFKSPGMPSVENEGIVGLRELNAEAVKSGKFDYDKKVEGLQALDRYTLRVKLREARPRHLYTWASRDILGAVAREVVEAYGDQIMDHPVGTGPFRLTEWRRSSRIVLTRNPGYREHFYEAEPNADDAEGHALVQRFKGRRLPMADKVEIAIIEQTQPRWLSFINGEQNFLERLPTEFADQAVPRGKLAPNLAKQGIQAYRVPGADVTLVVFNIEHPVVGGYTPEKVALRRAMILGNDVNLEIRSVWRGQAIPAQTIVPPLTEGYRADVRTESAVYDPARARALLDLYGYVDRNGDGWREQPDGSPLVIEFSTQSDQQSRSRDELWKKSLDALGIRMVLKTAQWPENLKAVRSGKFMVWRVGSSAATPDGHGALERAFGGSIGKGNLARFKLEAFDEIYQRMKMLPSGPERQALFDKSAQLMTAYAPYRLSVHRIITDMSYSSVVGYRRPPFWLDWWQYVDIDAGAREKSA
jgi:ABC-type transport system substrate-binding protein